MKKTSLVLAVLLFTVCSAFGQHRETLNVPSFDHIKLDGNIRLYIEQHSEAVVEVEARKEYHLDEYRMEVRGGTLHIKARDNGFRSTAKIRVYIGHPELQSIDADGLVHIYSKGPIQGDSFYIKGDGMIRGEVEVEVEQLKVDLDGFCSMSFAGTASESDLRLDGLGGIDARDLLTDEVQKSAEGLARIRVAKLH